MTCVCVAGTISEIEQTTVRSECGGNAGFPPNDPGIEEFPTSIEQPRALTLEPP